MGKLIKYEWRKQKTSRMVILVMLAVGIIAYIYGLLFNNNIAGICMVLMFCGAVLVLFYTGIESIIVLNRDLRTRQSYMMWMVPKSVWEILGAKFISAILQMLFAFAIFFAAGCVCVGIAIAESGGIRAIVEAVQEFIRIGLEIEVSWVDLIMFAVYFFVGWVEIIFIGFLSVLMSRTVLIRSKFAGLVAVILFFVVNFIVEQGYSLMYRIPGIHGADLAGGWNPWDIVYYVVIALVVFGISGWIADRKLSV